MLISKQPKLEFWIFYLKFILEDGHQMVNVNLFDIGLFFNSMVQHIFKFKYLRFVILTNYKNQSVNPNKDPFQNP